MMGTTAVETCANCGQAIGRLETPYAWGDYVVCAGCYRRLAEQAPPASPPPADGDTIDMRPAASPVTSYRSPAARAPAGMATNWAGVLGLLAGVFGMLLVAGRLRWEISMPLPLAAVLFGLIGLYRASSSSRKMGRGMALIALILGAIVLVWCLSNNLPSAHEYGM